MAELFLFIFGVFTEAAKTQIATQKDVKQLLIYYRNYLRSAFTIFSPFKRFWALHFERTFRNNHAEA